jgi:hypothetical protein
VADARSLHVASSWTMQGHPGGMGGHPLDAMDLDDISPKSKVSGLLMQVSTHGTMKGCMRHPFRGQQSQSSLIRKGPFSGTFGGRKVSYPLQGP